jgi:hypothetical protein
MFPDRPLRKGTIRINTLPGTDAQRRALHTKQANKPKPFAPTIRRAKEIVPNELIPKLKPLPPFGIV